MKPLDAAAAHGPSATVRRPPLPLAVDVHRPPAVSALDEAPEEARPVRLPRRGMATRCDRARGLPGLARDEGRLDHDLFLAFRGDSPR